MQVGSKETVSSLYRYYEDIFHHPIVFMSVGEISQYFIADCIVSAANFRTVMSLSSSSRSNISEIQESPRLNTFNGSNSFA